MKQNPNEIQDDGISGTRFDRQGFQQMISDIEADKVGVVIIMDMSRFGRDYLQIGTYMELLRVGQLRAARHGEKG